MLIIRSNDLTALFDTSIQKETNNKSKKSPIFARFCLLKPIKMGCYFQVTNRSIKEYVSCDAAAQTFLCRLHLLRLLHSPGVCPEPAVLQVVISQWLSMLDADARHGASKWVALAQGMPTDVTKPFSLQSDLCAPIFRHCLLPLCHTCCVLSHTECSF